MSRLITIAALRRFACYVCAALLVAACEDTTNPAMQKLASPSLQVLGASSNVTIRTTELGPIPVNQGFNRCGARRVSNNGLAVGGCENPFTGQTRAVTWLLDPSIPSSLDAHDLGLGPFADERNVGPVAEDVNDDALIVGEGFVSPTEGDRAFIFGTGFTLLAPLGNAARGINRFGQVVGGLRGGHAVLWTSPSTIMDLGTLGGLFSAASDINDNGQVVGQSDVDFGFVVRAFLWTADKGMAELPAPFGQSSRAVAINNTGQVAGFLGAFTGLQAVMWEPNGEMHFLGTLGGAASAANDINELGWVVGWSTTASDEVHGFVWTDQTGMVDLGTFSGNPTMAMGVNNRGEVVGIAVTRGSLPQPALVWRVELGMVNRPPIASAGGPYSGLEDSPVTFDANGSTDLDGDALTFEWDLGDRPHQLKTCCPP